MFEYVRDAGLVFKGTKKIRPRTDGIVLHHSGVSKDQTVQEIHQYHINHNGWIGIGYNFLVYKNGEVYKGRGLEYTGAHCKGHNEHTIGICAIGDYEHEQMTDAQKQSIIRLIADIYASYPSKITFVKGHKEMQAPGYTECPGKYYPIEEMRNAPTQQAKVSEKPVEVKQTPAYDFANLQRLVGTKDDNIPGPKTLEACSKHVLKKKTIFIVKDNIVLWVQTRLNYLGFNCGTPDGKFGKNTEKAVKDFQAAKGLKDDGIVGPKTWAKLLGL